MSVQELLVMSRHRSERSGCSPALPYPLARQFVLFESQSESQSSFARCLELVLLVAGLFFSVLSSLSMAMYWLTSARLQLSV